jgi:hypothetical protein
LLNGVLLSHQIGRPMDWDRVADNYTNFIMQGLTCPPSHDHSASAPSRRRPAAKPRRPRRAAAASRGLAQGEV